MSLLKENQEVNPEEVKEETMQTKTVSKKQYDHLARAREAKKLKAELKQHNNKFFMEQLNNVHAQLGTLNTQMGALINKIDSSIVPPVVGMKRKMDAEVEIEEEVKPTKLQKTLDKKPPEEDLEEKETTETWVKNEFMTSVGKFLGLGLAMIALTGYKHWKEKEVPPANYLYKNIQ